MPLADGSVPQEHILDAAPDIGWEIDVAWVIRGGADPMEWIDDYGRRIVAVHVKDIAPAGQNDGRGRLGRCRPRHRRLERALIKLLRDKTPAKYYVMEHDNPSDVDALRQAVDRSRARHF